MKITKSSASWDAHRELQVNMHPHQVKQMEIFIQDENVPVGVKNNAVAESLRSQLWVYISVSLFLLSHLFQTALLRSICGATVPLRNGRFAQSLTVNAPYTAAGNGWECRSEDTMDLAD